MRLSWRRSSGAEDRLEKWIAQQHQRRVLAGETTPSGPCPDEAFLRALARRSNSIDLLDPRVDHAATCPNCMSRLLELRREYQMQRRKLAWALAGAACVILVVGLFAWSRYESRRQQMLAQAPPVPELVDLWNAATYRGLQPGQLQSVLLPAARVHLTIILPRFSQAGQYLIAVTRDQNGNGIVAEGTAATTANGTQERIIVDLDLRSAKAGAYFLSTTHEQDQAAYYYPLQIK
jgi:hypothetical protein